MPKQKTHKGTKKRFRLTANGKIKHRPAGTSHLAARKSQKRIRKLRGTEVLNAGMGKAIRKRWPGIAISSRGGGSQTRHNTNKPAGHE